MRKKRNNIKKMKQEILRIQEELETLTPGTEEYDKAVKSLDSLAGVYLKLVSNGANTNKTRFATYVEPVGKLLLGTAGVLAPLVFYNEWFKMGYELEQDGNISSPTMRSLYQKGIKNR